MNLQKYIHKTRTSYHSIPWRERIFLAILHIAKIIDAIIYLITFSYFSSNIGTHILANEELGDWVEPD